MSHKRNCNLNYDRECGICTCGEDELTRLRASLASAESRLAIAVGALEKIAFKPIGHPEAADREVLDGITEIARATLSQARSKS